MREKIDLLIIGNLITLNGYFLQFEMKFFKSFFNEFFFTDNY